MNKGPRNHDPKVVPPLKESVQMAVEFTEEELAAIDELIREEGLWSREAFLRSVTADAVEESRLRR
jgi:hypothetical protein